jgi:hypothetical protein
MRTTLLGARRAAGGAPGGRTVGVPRREEDGLLAADPDTGATLLGAPRFGSPPRDYSAQFGPGPHATPLVDGGRVFSITVSVWEG